ELKSEGGSLICRDAGEPTRRAARGFSVPAVATPLTSGRASIGASRYFIAGVAEDSGPNAPRPTLPATSRTMPPIERQRQRLWFGGLAAALARSLSDAPIP